MIAGQGGGERSPAVGGGRGTWRPRLAVASACLVVALVAAGCGTGDEASEPAAAGDQTVRIAFVPATTGLALHVAEAQGYFAQNGLEVELTEAANISDIPPALGQQFDITLGTATDLIRASSAGLDVVQISGNTVSTADNPFVQVVVPADSDITDVAGLEGRRVGSPTLSGVINVAVLWWAQENGVDPASIDGVQVPPPNLPDQLTAGQVDAVQALEPFATQLLADGNVSLGDPFSPIADPLATNFWMAQGAWAEGDRETVAGFVDALEQAIAFIDENEDEARMVLQEFTGMPPQAAATTPLPTFDTEIRTDDLATWQEVLRAVGEFEGEVEPDELVLSGT